MKPGEEKILDALSASEGLTYTELKTKTGLSPPSLSGYIKKMMSAGLIAKKIGEKKYYIPYGNRDISEVLKTMVSSPQVVPRRQGVKDRFNPVFDLNFVGMVSLINDNTHTSYNSDYEANSPEELKNLLTMNIYLGAIVTHLKLLELILRMESSKNTEDIKEIVNNVVTNYYIPYLNSLIHLSKKKSDLLNSNFDEIMEIIMQAEKLMSFPMLKEYFKSQK